MQAYRTEKILGEDGRLALDDLPFNAGQRVEIIVLTTEAPISDNPYPLRDTPYRYDDPFAPLVDPDEWEAAK